jgi:preprotein translocase subunit Sec61beta
MARDNRIHMPGIFGGLMRYDDEYKSKFMITPSHVIAFIVVILLFTIILKVLWPVG